MQSRLTKVLALTGGIAAAGVLTATAAVAHAAPFTVTAGSAAAGTTINVSATSGTFKFLDTTTNVTLQCTSVQATGSIVTGSGQSGTHIAQINGAGATFNGCTGPAGLTLAVTGYGTWYIDITDSTSGVSTGRISNIKAHVASTNPSVTCTFDVGQPTSTTSFTSSDGTVNTVPVGSTAAKFTNSTQTIDAVSENPGQLGLWNVHGSGTNQYCVTASIIKQGNLATISQGSFPLTVTSPSGASPIAIS